MFKITENFANLRTSYFLRQSILLACAFLLLPSCSLRIKKKSPGTAAVTAAPAPTPTPTPFTGTGDINKKWLSECIHTESEYVQVYFDIVAGVGTSNYYFYGLDSTCSNGYVFMTAYTSDYRWTVHPTVTGVPAGFEAYNTDDTTNSIQEVAMLYWTSSTSFRMIASDPTPLVSNDWNDWKIADTTIADFETDPTLNTFLFTEVSQPPSAASSTFAWDGIYDSDCFATSASESMRYVFKIDDGNYSRASRLYSNSATCLGTYTLVQTNTTTPVADVVFTSLIASLGITGLPTDLEIFDGPPYAVVKKIDETHLQFWTEASTTNYGATWTNWTTGDPEMTTFNTTPTTLVPSTGFNLELFKQAAVQRIDGKWISQCYDGGSGTYLKRYENVYDDSGNGDMVASVTYYSYGADAACSGFPVRVETYTRVTGFTSTLPLLHMPNYFAAHQAKGYGAASDQFYIHYQTTENAFDRLALDPGALTITGWEFQTWKSDTASVNVFATNPSANSAGVYHFSRVGEPSGTVPAADDSTTIKNKLFYLGLLNGSSSTCTTAVTVDGPDTYNSYQSFFWLDNSLDMHSGHTLYTASDCTGDTIFYDTTANAEVATPSASTNIMTFTPIVASGTPAGIVTGIMSNGVTTYYLIMSTAKNPIILYVPLLSGDPVNPALWSDWVTALGAGNMASLLSNPMTYNGPTGGILRPLFY